MADLTGYALLKVQPGNNNWSKNSSNECTLNAKWRVLAQSGEYWVLLATLARTKIQSIFQQCSFQKVLKIALCQGSHQTKQGLKNTICDYHYD